MIREIVRRWLGFDTVFDASYSQSGRCDRMEQELHAIRSVVQRLDSELATMKGVDNTAPSNAPYLAKMREVREGVDALRRVQRAFKTNLKKKRKSSK